MDFHFPPQYCCKSFFLTNSHSLIVPVAINICILLHAEWIQLSAVTYGSAEWSIRNNEVTCGYYMPELVFRSFERKKYKTIITAQLTMTLVGDHAQREHFVLLP